MSVMKSDKVSSGPYAVERDEGASLNFRSMEKRTEAPRQRGKGFANNHIRNSRLTSRMVPKN